jgi:hypothetical protein
MHLRVAVDLARGGDEEAGAMALGQPERVVRPVGADLQRVQRQPQVVDRAGGRREVVHEVDRLVDVVRLDDVDVQVHELGPADVLDVRERAGLEVVDADDAVTACEELVTEMRAQEAGTAGDQACGHNPASLGRLALGDLPRGLHRSLRQVGRELVHARPEPLGEVLLLESLEDDRAPLAARLGRTTALLGLDEGGDDSVSLTRSPRR